MNVLEAYYADLEAEEEAEAAVVGMKGVKVVIVDDYCNVVLEKKVEKEDERKAWELRDDIVEKFVPLYLTALEEGDKVYAEYLYGILFPKETRPSASFRV